MLKKLARVRIWVMLALIDKFQTKIGRKFTVFVVK